jgi:hypothetical protein
MAQTKLPKASDFDTLVIGADLSGLLMAHELELTGRKVALIEALDTLGGHFRPQMSPLGPLDNGLKLIPATPSSPDEVNWLSCILQKPIPFEVLDNPPVTFDNGKFQPFVGFGETPTEAASELSSYLQPGQLQLHSTPKDWVPALAQNFTGESFLKMHLTQLIVEDGFVIEAVFNGTKRFSASEIIFCAHPSLLAKALPENTIASRVRQKMSKGPYFTAVHLDLVHLGVVTESRAPHLLRGANQEPCVGLFAEPALNANGQTYQVSQWLTFLSSQLTDDAEVAAEGLKAIKRQIKRAYPEALNHLLYEKILIAPASHGHVDIELTPDYRLPKIENLWLGSHFWSPERNTLGAISQARRVLSQIGSAPVPRIEETLAPSLDL